MTQRHSRDERYAPARYRDDRSAQQAVSTVIPDIDIWRCAALMISNDGDTAEVEAASEADAMLAKGDADGRRVWLRIARAIDALTEVQRAETKQ